MRPIIIAKALSPKPIRVIIINNLGKNIRKSITSMVIIKSVIRIKFKLNSFSRPSHRHLNQSLISKAKEVVFS